MSKRERYSKKDLREMLVENLVVFLYRTHQQEEYCTDKHEEPIVCEVHRIIFAPMKEDQKIKLLRQYVKHHLKAGGVRGLF